MSFKLAATPTLEDGDCGVLAWLLAGWLPGARLVFALVLLAALLALPVAGPS